MPPNPFANGPRAADLFRGPTLSELVAEAFLREIDRQREAALGLSPSAAARNEHSEPDFIVDERALVDLEDYR